MRPASFRAAAVHIPATSERQALDWSLALASQDIACVIQPPDHGRGWTLAVDPADAGPALRTLRLYHLENRYRPSARVPLAGDLAFHWGVLLWCLLMILIYWGANAPGSPMMDQGTFVTATTRQGEFWRVTTATFLHAGPEHLTANLTTGFLLIGLAMGRFGVGAALLGTLLAGSAGNLFAWTWRAQDYLGLGASGVVMGALGMLSVALLSDARAGRLSRSAVTRGGLGGLLLFILFGTSSQSDVLAHAGGFLFGALAGTGLALLPERWTRSVRFDVLATLAYLIIGAGAWILALG